MTTLGDDLKAFMAGLGQLAESVTTLETAATSAAGKLKNIPDKIERLGEGFDRVVGASIEAGVNAALGAGAVAVHGEIHRPRDAGRDTTDRGDGKRSPSPNHPNWTPSTACIHDGTCKSPNPYACHHDMPRKHPDGLTGPGGATEVWFCGCGPCHPPQAVQTPPAAPQRPVASSSAPSATSSPSPIPTAGTGATLCHKHGSLVWNGHILCGNCRRVYQTTNPSADRYAPEVCVCSSNLRPQRKEPFAGRPLCQLCFLGNVQSGRMA